MNTSKFKKIIKEAMVEALNEHYKDVLTEVIKSNSNQTYKSIENTTDYPNPPKDRTIKEGERPSKPINFYESYKKNMEKFSNEKINENKEFKVNSKSADIVNRELPTEDLPLDSILQMTK